MSFELVGPAADVAKGSVITAEIDGVDVAVVHADDDRFYAVRDECSHAAVALSEGEVDGCTLECWLHGSRFDPGSGMSLSEQTRSKLMPARPPAPPDRGARRGGPRSCA